jgi:hypothetical protein
VVLIERHFTAKGFTKLLLKLLPGDVVNVAHSRLAEMRIQTARVVCYWKILGCKVGRGSCLQSAEYDVLTEHGPVPTADGTRESYLSSGGHRGCLLLFQLAQLGLLLRR